jgi:hypothetical protein
MQLRPMLLGVIVATASEAAGTPPHIVLMVADDLGFNDGSFLHLTRVATAELVWRRGAEVAVCSRVVLPSFDC